MDDSKVITGADAQVIILALGILAAERPGWHPACIAPLVAKFGPGAVKAYEEHRARNAYRNPNQCAKAVQAVVERRTSGGRSLDFTPDGAAGLPRIHEGNSSTNTPATNKPKDTTT